MYKLFPFFLLFALLLPPAPSAAAQTSRRCFAETGLCINGRFREYWEQNGGLPVFGLPITPLITQEIEGQPVQVQWFERHRLELHPANPRPYDVLMGRLGGDYLEQHTIESEPDSALSLEGECVSFEETGHRVCGAMLEAWRANGLELDGQPGTSYAESLALFGLPLSEARLETLTDGQQYTVQWFERARFEYHPQQPAPYRVQFGLLGRELYRQSDQAWPRFHPADCPFGVPGDLTIECGYLHVPEDRTQPDSRTIQLAVAIVHTRSATPAPDPVVYLSGGPGSPALVNTVTFARGWSHLLAHRDFVVLDQRGTGFSQPALTCPEASTLAQDLLGREVSRAEKVQAEIDMALRCRDRLVSEGVNVAGYRSVESAADLEDLRIALGYPQWNLLGISYGTRLALTAMRDYPHGIRSVVLDSVYPLQVNLFTAMPDNLNRSLTTLFARCASTPACNATYPDLQQVFAEVLRQLDENPVTVWPQNPHTGETVKVRVDGTEMVSLMFRLFYDTRSIGLLPTMIYDTHNGNYALLTQLEQRRLGRVGGGFSHGTYFSVECSDEIPFANAEEIDATREAYPQLRAFFAGIPENTPDILGLCEAWGTHPPDPAENEAVDSEIPTLILAGEYDPITPVPWAYIAAETLPNSVVHVFPDTGHAVISRGAHPQTIIRDFLDSPSP